MKTCLLSVLPCSFLLCACVARAGVIRETVTLKEGWNAVYLESTPETATCTDFFADLPVTRVGCYRSDAYADTAQYGADGAERSQKPISYYLWLRGNAVASTFTHLTGGTTYLVFATNTATKTFFGTPCAPKMTWRESTASDGLVNLAGVSIAAGTTVVARKYFGEGPAGANAVYWTVGGTGEYPTLLSLNIGSRPPSLAAGSAYGVTSAKNGDWPGAVRVRGEGVSGGLAFSDGCDQASILLANMTSTTRVVRVSQAASERSTDVEPTLRVYRSGKNAEGDSWADFVSETCELGPNETRVVRFYCDKQKLDFSKTNASLVVVEDLSGSQLRVRLPITVEPDALAADEGVYPAGLWVGRATFSQVSQGLDATPRAAGGRLNATILVHVDATGRPALLQRIALAQEPKATGGTHYVPYAELSDAPSTCAVSRVSTVLMDTANRIVGADAASAFGETATFRFIVAENSKENPFRHAWHPDHDGKSADYKSAAPSGDNPLNFIGAVKPESFSVTNTVSLVWRDAEGNTTFSREPGDSSYGRIDWKLEGLRADAPIYVRGVFVLQRVTDILEIKRK